MTPAQAQSKQTQIVQNFFSKSVQVIAEARLSPDELRNSDEAGTAGAASPSTAAGATAATNSHINKWFNLELKELDFLHESLKPWRQSSTNFDEHLPPPLVVETYLNPSKLRPGQTVVLDDARCSTNKEIVLERWVIEFKPSATHDSIPQEDLPAVYKRAIISIRSLYTAVRLLPTWQLRQKLSRQKLIHVPLKLGIRIHNGSMPISSRGRIGLSKSIAEKRSVLQQFHIQPISMSIGTLQCSVTYRTDVRFGVEDIEKVMAQKFMELDAPASSSSPVGTPSGGGGAGSYGTAGPFQPGSQVALGPRPILNFTRPFKTPDTANHSVGSGNSAATTGSAPGYPRSIPSSLTSQNPQHIQQHSSVSGSVSSVISTNSRFSSSFASQRTHGMAPRGAHDNSGGAGGSGPGAVRAASINSQGSHDGGAQNASSGLDPGSGLYMAQSDAGDFVDFIDETRKRGNDRIRQSSLDVDSVLSRYQNMRSSYVQLSDSIMQGSSMHPAIAATATASSSSGTTAPKADPAAHQETVKLDKRRGSGPRSRLGFYSEHDDDDERDQDLLFALSDMHT